MHSNQVAQRENLSQGRQTTLGHIFGKNKAKALFPNIYVTNILYLRKKKSRGLSGNCALLYNLKSLVEYIITTSIYILLGIKKKLPYLATLSEKVPGLINE